MNSLRILGLIPARGGSKGIPDKNLRPLAGKTLLERTAETARESGVITRLILSTDDDRIAELGREHGIEVPFMRPSELATDSSGMVDVMRHAVETLGEVFDAVMLLQPTSPLRTPEIMRQAAELLDENAESVCTVFALPLTHCPHYVMKITETGHLDNFLPEGKQIRRRQDATPAYVRDGTVFLTRTECLMSKGIYGDACRPLIVPESSSLSLDTPEDWARAEALLTGGS